MASAAARITKTKCFMINFLDKNSPINTGKIKRLQIVSLCAAMLRLLSNKDQTLRHRLRKWFSPPVIISRLHNTISDKILTTPCSSVRSMGHWPIRRLLQLELHRPLLEFLRRSRSDLDPSSLSSEPVCHLP